MHPLEVAALLVACGVYLYLGLQQIALGAPLGHDEAVYSVKAREFAEGSDGGAFWGPHRAPGLPIILAATWVLGGTEATIRSVVLSIGVIGILATWVLGRRLVGRGVGVTAAAMLGLTPGYLRNGVLVLPDMPGAVLGLLTFIAFDASASRERISRWVYLVVPLSIAATYVRFGAPIPIGIGLAALAIHKWGSVRRYLKRMAFVATLTAFGSAAVLYLPGATGTAESPAAAIAGRRSQLEGVGLWDSLGDFWNQIPDVLDPVLATLVIVGVVLGVAPLLTRQSNTRHAELPAAITVLTVVVLAASLPHGEPRYMIPALPFLMMTAAVGLVGLARKMDQRAVGLLAVAGVLGSLPLLSAELRGLTKLEFNRFEKLRTVSWKLEERLPQSCAIITSYTPQVAWYSECAAYPFGAIDVPVEVPPNIDRVTVLIANGGKRQPKGEELEQLRAGAPLVLEFGDREEGSLEYFYSFQRPASVLRD